MSPSARSIDRRQLLVGGVTGALALGLAPVARATSASRPARRTAPSERITLGFIGVGMMGRGHLGGFLGQDDVQVLAVCDVETTRRENAVKQVEARYAEATRSGTYRGCDGFVDFRDLLARDDIDAVVIATPDHWHVLNALHAIAAKKDVYCEKPLTHSIREGRLLVDAVRNAGTVFQTGSQQRSEFGGRFRTAVDLIRNGRIGRLKTVRVGVGAPPVACDLPTEPTPADVDWDLWLGPAPERGYNEILCPKGMHGHFPAFRNYLEYAGGGLADMGAHHFDIAQWAMDRDASGPVRIVPPADGSKSGLEFVFDDDVRMIHGGPSGCTFEGTDGSIYVDRGELKSEPGSILETPLTDADRRVYHSENHHRNWIECIRTRKRPICDVEIGHRSASLCHLANIAYRLGRELTWDPVAERFANDDAANALLFREPRGPWTYEL
ncbi:MAG TPA: Gfo/Idh/MocA family oxidoreductase [Pirellulaceae bacterium]|nr:Gfo/Idh/MocA family oxidoreductase [Pirellulaceae bacterium]